MQLRARQELYSAKTWDIRLTLVQYVFHLLHGGTVSALRWIRWLRKQPVKFEFERVRISSMGKGSTKYFHLFESYWKAKIKIKQTEIRTRWKISMITLNIYSHSKVNYATLHQNYTINLFRIDLSNTDLHTGGKTLTKHHKTNQSQSIA